MTIPANSVLPAVTGTVSVGSVLSTDNGTWSGSPTAYAYAWLRSGVAIAGATTSSYTVVADDVGNTLKSRVTASNVDGSAMADSAATTSVPSTLIVESWPLVANADCYVSLADANTYWAKRNDTTWAAATSGERESCLRQATAFLDANFNWAGQRNLVTQSLSWPRILEYGLDADRKSVTSTEIPSILKDACCELAKDAMAGSLAETVERGGQVQSESVAGISVTYAVGASVSKKYQLVELLLRKLLAGGGNSLTSMVRRA